MHLKFDEATRERIERIRVATEASSKAEVIRRALIVYCDIVEGNGEYIVCGQVRRLEMPR